MLQTEQNNVDGNIPCPKVINKMYTHGFKRKKSVLNTRLKLLRLLIQKDCTCFSARLSSYGAIWHI